MYNNAYINTQTPNLKLRPRRRGYQMKQTLFSHWQKTMIERDELASLKREFCFAYEADV